MNKSFRSIALKLLGVALIFCVVVSGITSIPSASVLADETSAFEVTEGASIRDGSKETDGNYGLRFESKVTDAWFTENDSTVYNFGTLIFPADKANAFSREKSVNDNKEDTEAVKFISKPNYAEKAGFTWSTSIVYNDGEVAKLMKNKWPEKFAEVDPTKDEIKEVMRKLYAMELTAVSFVETDSGVIYTDNEYTSSMIKVAARLQSNEAWAEKAKAYLGDGKVKNVKTYVDDDDNVIAKFDAQDVSQLVIGNDTLVANEDYVINDGAITFNADDVVAKKGTYEDIFVFDSQNNLTIINVLYATDVLSTAQQVKDALDYGKYDLKYMEENYETVEFKAHDGVYVLANDIDMTGYTFYNNYDTAYYSSAIYKMGNVGFRGIFDGMGKTISNATVEVKNYYAGNVTEASYPVLKAAGFGAWQNHKGYGIFHNILAGAAVRNVAFVNLNAIGQADGSNSTPLSGIFARTIQGTVENVYIDVNPASKDTENIKGLCYDIYYTASIKNVVINWPMNDWVFDYNALTTNSSFTYGTSSFATAINRTNAIYENIYVISPKPLSYTGDGSEKTGELDSLTEDYFVYGANENTVYHNHAVNGDKTFEELVVDYKKDGKVRVLPAAVKYNSIEDAAKSQDQTTLAMREALAKTGYFKVVNKQVVWHDAKVNQTISTDIDFNASTGELITTELDDQEILSITIGDQVLTKGNGFEQQGNELILYAKQSIDDEKVGVPFIENTTLTPEQKMTLTVETKDVIYTLPNVYYWTAFISDADDFKAFIEIDPGTTYASNSYNKGLYKLTNDIDFEDDEGNLVTMDYYNRSTSNTVYQAGQNGFAGVFDGNGYTIADFAAKTYGLFSTLTSYGINGRTIVVKNFAMTNVRTSYKFDPNSNTITYGPVLAFAMHWNNNVDTEISNIYVQVNSGSDMTHGLISIPCAKLKLNNVFVEYNKAAIKAPSNYVFDKDYSSADGNTYMAYNPTVWNSNLSNSATLFRSLRRVGTTMDKNITNVYVASPQPVAIQILASSSIYGMWTHSATNKTHTLTNSGYTTGTSGYEYYYGYASNETRGTVPVIVDMSEDFKTISLMDGFFNNTIKTAYPCNKCGRITTTEAKNSACNITAGCTGKFVNNGPDGIWDEVESYVWGFHELGENYQNQAISGSNGIWQFSGVKKYDTKAIMDGAENTYDSFVGNAGNGLWSAENGVLTWVGNKKMAN